MVVGWSDGRRRSKTKGDAHAINCGEATNALLAAQLTMSLPWLSVRVCLWQPVAPCFSCNVAYSASGDPGDAL